MRGRRLRHVLAPAQAGLLRPDTRVTGCGKKVGVNGAYVFAHDTVSVTLTPVISKSLFGKWLYFEVRYEK